MNGNSIASVELALIVGAAVVVVFVARWFRDSGRLPPQKTFRCARCSTNEMHSSRTIEAWRAGKKKLFCGACHAQWLRSQPSGRGIDRKSSSGCLGMLVLGAIVPMLTVAAFYYAHHFA
jgi:hypothetical protein